MWFTTDVLTRAVAIVVLLSAAAALSYWLARRRVGAMVANPIIVSRWADYFGRSSAGAFQVRGAGIAVLGADAIAFVMFGWGTSVYVERTAIRRAWVQRSFMRAWNGRHVLCIEWEPAPGKLDTVGLAVRRPEVWVAALSPQV